MREVESYLASFRWGVVQVGGVQGQAEIWHLVRQLCWKSGADKGTGAGALTGASAGKGTGTGKGAGS